MTISLLRTKQCPSAEACWGRPKSVFFHSKLEFPSKEISRGTTEFPVTEKLEHLFNLMVHSLGANCFPQVADHSNQVLKSKTLQTLP